MRKHLHWLPFVMLLPGLLCAAPSAERQGELRNLLYQDCGSCHGMRLTGGLGPALTPDALQGKSRELLLATVREGRSGTPMPPWKQQLSDTDIAWLVNLLLNPENTP
jgi:cytochrome c55X